MMGLMERYRPKSLDEIVGQDEVIKSLRGLVRRCKSRGEPLPHMLFIGPPGCGKTSTAMALAREYFGENWRLYFKEYNASDDRRIQDVREKYKPMSRFRGKRIIFLDEADRMTPDAQHALRRIMETTPSTTFILSGNDASKIIDAIKSRCVIYRFRRLSDRDVLKRLLQICRAEGVKMNLSDPNVKEGFKLLVREAKGDLRRAINTLEKLINEKGEITVEAVALLREPRMAIDALKMAIEGNFTKALEMIEDAYISAGYDPAEVVNEWYEGLRRLDLEDDVKIRLYRELGEVEGRLRGSSLYGATPLIQLASFLAYAWVAPRLLKCPALERER